MAEKSQDEAWRWTLEEGVAAPIKPGTRSAELFAHGTARILYYQPKGKGGLLVTNPFQAVAQLHRYPLARFQVQGSERLLPMRNLFVSLAPSEPRPLTALLIRPIPESLPNRKLRRSITIASFKPDALASSG